MDFKTEMNGYEFFGDGKKDPTNWKRGKYIGRGGMGKVYQGTVEESDRNVEFAVKEIPINSKSKGNDHKKCFDREIDALKILSHERIVQYYGFCKTESKFHIFIEFMPKGSLDDFIKEKGIIHENQASRLTKQILEGVAYLHGARIRIFHRDIKSENVLMINESSVKLTDFGLARVFGEITETYTQLMATIRFMAPEMIAEKSKYNRKVDIWAVGCVVLHMLTGCHPYAEIKEEMQVLFRLCKLKPDLSPAGNFLSQIPENARKFLEKTFQVDQTNRPTAECLLTDLFITGINSTKQEEKSKKILNFLFFRKQQSQ